jgi:DNA polymerase-3 subunit beta
LFNSTLIIAHTLHVQCAGTSVTLTGISADEFPVLPPGSERTPDAIFPAGALCDAIRQVAFATATDDTRPTLTGVSLHIDSRTATLTAADGCRLARRTLTLAEAAPSQLNTIIPARTLMELARCIGDNSGNVYVTPTPSGGQVIFHTVDLEIVSRIIDGVYPDMSRIIPHTYATHALLDRQELRASVNGAALIAAAAANVLSLQLEPGDHQSLGTVTISAHAAEVGEHSTVLEGAITGESGRLLLNAGYVADVVEAIPSAQVILELQTAQSPAVFRAVGADDYVCVIMPMHMR